MSASRATLRHGRTSVTDVDDHQHIDDREAKECLMAMIGGRTVILGQVWAPRHRHAVESTTKTMTFERGQ
jgi:hypothetical protein